MTWTLGLGLWSHHHSGFLIFPFIPFIFPFFVTPSQTLVIGFTPGALAVCDAHQLSSDVTCCVISDPEVNTIMFRSTDLQWLSNAV